MEFLLFVCLILYWYYIKNINYGVFLGIKVVLLIFFVVVGEVGFVDIIVDSRGKLKVSAWRSIV